MNDKSKKWTSQVLAEFITDLQNNSLADSTLEMAGRCVLDSAGAAAAGFDTPAAKAVRKFCERFYPEGPASVWYDKNQRSTAGAAMANTAAASALDVDDGNRRACGHPGAAMVPAAVALAQEVNAGAKELLTAVAIGYEVGIRIASSRNPKTIDTFSTGRWAAYGVAAAGAFLRKTAAETLSHALSIAGNHSPIQSASGYGKVGNNVKEGIPWSVVSGIAALDLAQAGFTGPLDIFDNPDYYDTSIITQNLGSSYAIEQTYFKPYACCRWFHAAIDALIDMMNEHQLSAEAIKSVVVHTFKEAIKEKNETAPKSIEGAQYSYPFSLAIAAYLGSEGLLPIAETALKDKGISNWAECVELVLDQEIEDDFPRTVSARIILNTEKGKLERFVEYALGDPDNPFTLQYHRKKILTLLAQKIPDDKAQDLVDSILGLSHGKYAGFHSALE
ncbi:MAG: MmgE/PrpD family protein [Planctomycetota bacterium]|jgi:2-methylcitrate dehydratase PrpD